MSTIKVDTIATRSGSGSVTVSNNIALATEGQIDINSTNLLVRSTGNKSGLRFDTSAYTPFKNGSAADNTVDLGFASGRYKDLFLGGGAYLGGTVAANYLDDYEQGTWTPTLVGFGGGNTQTYSSQIGKYTKIGQQVVANYQVRLSAKGNISGSYLHIMGLPFALSGSPSGTGMIHYIWALGTARDNIAWEMGGGTTDRGWLTYLDGTTTGYVNTSDIGNTTGFMGTLIFTTDA